MRIAVLCGIAVLVAFAPGASAQTPPPNTGPSGATTENPRLSRQLDPKRAAAKKAKRLECEQQAKEQKLHLAKRLQFIRKCLAAS
jgi:hypothetical protein